MFEGVGGWGAWVVGGRGWLGGVSGGGRERLGA